jgi:uncharacterized protein YndB with AHSA1/START domain
MNRKLQHATINLQHSYPLPVERVFAEFANPLARARWSVPSGDVLIYDQTDFRIGGKDAFRCGPKANPKFCGETHYLDIVPNVRAISSETLEMNGERLAVALITLDFESAEKETTVIVTVQMVSFAGPEVIQGYESGNQGALRNLYLYLSKT